ncbi:MAG: GAF domain-containing protein [Chitinophagaceae bacterium]|nr:GAF domain-containing protein [Chitinophagaceae bacterium]
MAIDNTFNKPIVPENEELRLKALEYYDILNDLPDRYFSNLAHIMASAFNTKIALISLVGEDTVFFKGNFGMEGTTKANRGHSLCSLAVLDSEPTVFRDALKEPCLLGNPLVIGDFGLRFYAGAPIVTKEGFNIGTACVVGFEPRDFSNEEKTLLGLFAENAMIEIESRRELMEQQKQLQSAATL